MYAQECRKLLLLSTITRAYVLWGLYGVELRLIKLEKEEERGRESA